ADRNCAGVGAARAGAAEADGDSRGDVVREVGERNDAIRCRRRTGGPLQGATARQARRRHYGARGNAVGRAAQVAELIPDLEDRLLGKGHTRRRRRGRLRQNVQGTGRTGDFAQGAEVHVGGKTHDTGRPAAAQVAADQRRAGDRANTEALPGQLGLRAVLALPGDGERYLRRGARRDAALNVVGTGPAAGRGDRHGWGRAARIEDEPGRRVQDDRAGADLAGGILTV